MTNQMAPQAHAQWVEIEIFAENMDITIKNTGLEYGKFHTPGNKDAEIDIGKINGTTIKSGRSYKIAACGRENSFAGTEGKFSLYHGDELLGEYYWDCPWSRKENKSHFEKKTNDTYELIFSPGNLHSGAIGSVSITLIKRH